MRNEISRRFAYRALVAACILPVLALAPADAGDAKVRILGAEASPALFSPASGAAMTVEATVLVQEVAGIRGSGRRSDAAESKRYLAAWSWTLTGASAEAVTSVHGSTVLEPDSRTGGPRSGMTGDIEVVWDGLSPAGEAVRDGRYAWSLRVDVVRLDETGNGRVQEKPIGSDVQDGIVEIDGTPPWIEIGSVPACSRGPVVPVIEVGDANLRSWQAFLNGAPYVEGEPVTTDGEYLLRVEAVDLAGNETDTEVAFVVDTVAPVIRIIGVADGDVAEPGLAPVVEIEDDHLTASSITLDGDAFESGTPVERPGDHVLRAEAEDCAGNRSQAEVRFEIADVGAQGSTRAFTNEDDRALVESVSASGVRVWAFGLRGPDGLTERVTAIRGDDPNAPVSMRFDDAGRLSVLEEPGGIRLEFRWLDDGAVQMTVADADGSVQTAARLGAPSEIAAAPLPEVGSVRGGEDRVSWLRPRAGGSVTRADLERSMIPLPPVDPAPQTASAAAVGGGACEGGVRVSTCGVPAEHARVQVRVVGSGADAPSYVVPAVDGGEAGFGYSLACDAVPALDAGEVCASAGASSAGVCADLDRLRGLGALEVCRGLAAPLTATEALRLGSADCAALFGRAGAACGSMASACEDLPEAVDRRAGGPLTLEAHALSDATGPLDASVEVDGTGPFPQFDLRADDRATIARFRPVWIDAENVEITALAVCAEPGAPWTYTAEICDFDAFGCSSFPVPGEIGADGSDEIGFRFTSQYGADEVRVTVEIDGGPSRRIVITF